MKEESNKEISNLLQEFEIAFENSSLFDCWDGCKDDLIKYFRKALLSYRNTILKECKEKI